MKKITTILLLLLSGFGFAQTSNDVITFPINTTYLNSLVLKTCNERTLNEGVVKQSNIVTFKCAEYQSAYQSNFSICTHTNTKHFRGYQLETMVNRREVFNKPKQLNGSMGEICTFAKFTYDETTYNELANHIIDNFFSSSPHRRTIFIDYPYGDFSCTYGIYENTKGVYVTGVFSR